MWLLGKSTWFKNKKKRRREVKNKNKSKDTELDKKHDSPEIVTVLFVPQTPMGELAKRLQIVENRISKLSGGKSALCCDILAALWAPSANPKLDPAFWRPTLPQD